MFIYSQDKEKLYDMNNSILKINKYKDNSYIIMGYDKQNSYYGYTLGSYTSEAKAKQVIKDIIDAYNNCNVKDIYGNQCGYVKNNVFNMPENKYVKIFNDFGELIEE